MAEGLTVEEAVREILRDALHLGPRADNLSEESALFGTLPEFDSMAVVTVLTLVEEEFGIEIHDDEISADVFLTVGTLAEFITAKVRA